MVWIPLLISFFRRRSAIWLTWSSLASMPADARSARVRREALAAVLVRGDLSDDLGRDVAGRVEAVGLVDLRAGDHRPVLEHVVQVDQIAIVLAHREIIGVVEMDQPVLVGLHNVLRQKEAARQVAADFPGDVVPLGRVDRRIFVGVLLLDQLVVAVDQRENPSVRRVGAAQRRAFVAVVHVGLRHFVAAHFHDARFDKILNVFDVGGVGVAAQLLFHVVGHGLDLAVVEPADRVHLDVGLRHRVDDLAPVVAHLLTAALDDIHHLHLCSHNLLLFLILLNFVSSQCI